MTQFMNDKSTINNNEIKVQKSSEVEEDDALYTTQQIIDWVDIKYQFFERLWRKGLTFF